MFLLLRLIVLPVRLAFTSVRLGYATGRLIGYRRLFVFGAGVAVGLLVAPTTGERLRAKLREAFEATRATGGTDLAERVRFELSHAPRTWHLPQPDVEVAGGRVVLRGEVPHETGRADLERAAAAVAGVDRVDNQLSVSGTNGSH